MKQYRTSLIIILMLVVLIIPAMALAVWWNPLTWNWNIFNIVSKPHTSTVAAPQIQIQNTTVQSEPATENQSFPQPANQPPPAKKILQSTAEVNENQTYQYVPLDQKYGLNPKKITTSDPVAFPAAFVSPQGTIYGIPKSIAIQIDSMVRGDSKGGNIGPMGAITNPTDQNALVVETDEISCTQNSGDTLSTCASTHRFYNYNLTNPSLKLLYTTSDQSAGDGTGLLPVATQATTIILKMYVGETSCVCCTTWDKNSSYYYFDLNNPSQGLINFKVPQYLIDESSVDQAKCFGSQANVRQ